MSHASPPRRLVLSALLSAFFAFFAPHAHATVASCQAVKKQATEGCAAAFAGANAASNAKAGQVAASCKQKDANGNAKKGISVCADDMKQTGAFSNTELDKANATCDTQKASCEKGCDPAKEKPEEKAAVAKLKKACTDDIDAKKAEGNAGKKGSDQAQKESDATKKESENGGMPPASPPKSEDSAASGGEQPAAPSSTPPLAATPEKEKEADKGKASFAPNCADGSGAHDSRCTAELAGKCGTPANRDSAVCRMFRNAYCSKNGGAAPASLGDDALKPASGIGSGYCQSVAGGEWCEAQKGRDDCNSCRKKRGLPALPTVDEKVCGTDPDYVANAVSSGAKGQSLAGGAGTGGTGGGSSAGGSGSVGAAELDKEKKTGEPESKREEIGGGVDSAGGYSSGGGESSTGSDYSPQSTGASAPGAGRAYASNDAGTVAGTTDVQGQYGPNVFSILGEVFRNLCQNGRVMHCVPSKK